MLPPACPITGDPARRLVQWVPAEWPAILRRQIVRVDARPSFRDSGLFGAAAGDVASRVMPRACPDTEEGVALLPVARRPVSTS